MRLQQSSSHPPNQTYISLTRLLSRLEEKFPADVYHVPTSRPSAFEMAKVKANLEYAHTLLQQLENEAVGLKNLSQRQIALSDLQPQRISVKRLQDVISSLELLEDTTVIRVIEEPSAADEEEEKTSEALAQAAVPPKPTVVTQSNLAPPVPTATAAPSNEPTSVLRNRLGKYSEKDENAELSAEEQLSHDRHEQDDLSESLLKMAEQLKANSRRFADELEGEKDILRTAADGLDKNTTGLQGAGLRMLKLKQGQDVTWWYQLKVFAALLGLALTAIIIFWLPKLRWGSFTL
ncbi:hypothetical protein TWF679_009987 [Orbilia oligospora]|uniref:Synaptobrevin n=1 Tax=Orbilia oligospora TaxID=2813651 RepID=A0A8H8V1D8_ORBOL|nr:hypothetical protein TWF679_009987 [Orbilia oligospora]